MTIGQKLRFFADDKHGGVSNLAELMGIKTPSLYPYLNDESVPGGLMLQKLYKLGCDINWLLDEDGIIKEPKIEYGVRDLEKEIAKLRKAIKQIQNVLDKLNREEL